MATVLKSFSAKIFLSFSEGLSVILMISLRQVVFAVAGDGRHVEALDVVVAVFSVAIDHVVDCALVVSLEDGHVDDFRFPFFGLAFFRLAHERLVGDADDLVRAVAVEDDGVVDVGTVGDELVFLESGADESLVAVDV